MYMFSLAVRLTHTNLSEEEEGNKSPVHSRCKFSTRFYFNSVLASFVSWLCLIFFSKLNTYTHTRTRIQTTEYMNNIFKVGP